MGAEGTNAGLANSWLAGYLEAKPVLDSVAEADASKSPFKKDGRVYIYLADFRRWVHVSHGDRVPPKELGIMLRRAGAAPDKVDLTLDGRATSRQVWALGETFKAPEHRRSLVGNRAVDSTPYKAVN